jgi:hypothetical protein
MKLDILVRYRPVLKVLVLFIPVHKSYLINSLRKTLTFFGKLLLKIAGNVYNVISFVVLFLNDVHEEIALKDFRSFF